jgi:predicted peptidase
MVNRSISKIFILFVLLAFSTISTWAQDALSMTTARFFTNDKDETLPYRIYVPKTMPQKHIPLVFFMHGAGERGDDNEAQVKHGVRDLIMWSKKNEPMIIIAPQCPKNKRWVEVDWSKLSHTMPPEPSYAMRLSMQIIETLCKELPVDLRRLYVTGLSMGGYGTWDIIQRYPGRFAAAMPVCGGGDVAGVSRFKNLPIWTFHGDKDGAVPVSRSRDMVKALKKAGSKVKYTEYPGVNHDCWTRTYANPDVLKWFFSQKRQ